ncbi:hypothetical protein ALC60_12132 [Trachymyrmex zeteki]|uniref:Myb/SANT-like DNA-binding domain-containing protein n=2 Tax=Mycetomoellerius zeteki TaxID=64791 RepID=A0A151WLX6_9HYME|nr:hypothetical protein ALC60_12132 [Trachymyrmex zeteki]
MFIQLYADYEPAIVSGKLKQKTVFEKISRQLAENDYTFSAKQCASKLTALKRMYKKIKDHNNTSGNDRQTWQYFFYGSINNILLLLFRSKIQY